MLANEKSLSSTIHHGSNEQKLLVVQSEQVACRAARRRVVVRRIAAPCGTACLHVCNQLYCMLHILSRDYYETGILNKSMLCNMIW